MFWLRNIKINFQLCLFILGPRNIYKILYCYKYPMIIQSRNGSTIAHLVENLTQVEEDVGANTTGDLVLSA